MVGMVGVTILIARETILMTRMVAQICQNTTENKKTHPYIKREEGTESAGRLWARTKRWGREGKRVNDQEFFEGCNGELKGTHSKRRKNGGAPK